MFTDFPTATIIWVIYSIVYQQIENTLIQPQIQKRAVNVHPFLVLVAVLFGSTLLGVLGALRRDPDRRLGADRRSASGGPTATTRTCSEIVAPAASKPPPDAPSPPEPS